MIYHETDNLSEEIPTPSMQYPCEADFCSDHSTEHVDRCCGPIEKKYGCPFYSNNKNPYFGDFQQSEDMVQTPYDKKATYYCAGGIETLDIIKAKLTKEQYRGWLLGNCIKYTCRANFKDCFDRDIEKVGFYSGEIEKLNVDKDGDKK